MKAAQIPDHSLLLIENHVEALSHHALPDLGQIANVLLMSVTEGDSKPLKYPGLFVQSDICVITKTDLLPYVDFNTDKVKTAARSLCPQSSVLEISAKTGKGLEEWLVWFDAMYHKANP
jgi:hydrogenase nickel incorporation protein HypB